VATKHTISFADKNLLQSVVTPEVLTPLVPRIGEIADGVKAFRDMQHEISVLGHMSRRTGFVKGGHFQLVARIPSSVRAAVLQIMPDAFTDKKQFYELLAGPLKAYDTRSKIVL
jgi:hypothetical protein